MYVLVNVMVICLNWISYCDPYRRYCYLCDDIVAVFLMLLSILVPVLLSLFVAVACIHYRMLC